MAKRRVGSGSGRVNWVAGQNGSFLNGSMGYRSNGSGQTGLTRFAMSKENTHEMALLKEQMAKMICIMQQLVVRGNWWSHGPFPESFAPYSENENQPTSKLNQDQTTPIFTLIRNQPESSYRQVKSQVETLIEKVRIIKGFGARGSVNLDNLTNFP